MKYIILSILSFLSLNLSAQYSRYYDIRSQSNVDINHNINSHKTIHSIDYGALAIANAQNEKNRLARAKYENQRAKEIALSIAENPIVAYNYGSWQYLNSKNFKKYLKKHYKEYVKNEGIKTFNLGYVNPSNVFNGLSITHLQNTSSNGITTNIHINFKLAN